MIGVRTFTRRVALPTAAAWLTHSRIEGAVRHRVRRATGRRARAELFLALDDPYSILALEAARRVQEVRALDVELLLVDRSCRSPLLRGQLRTDYAVMDAARLSALRGQPFARTRPLKSDEVLELSAMIESARPSPGFDSLVHGVLERVWRQDDELPDFGELYALFHRTCGGPPPRVQANARGRLTDHGQRMLERGPWDTSSLWFDGAWFFAHEREGQILDATRELRS